MTVGSIADYERLLRRSKIMEALTMAAEYFLNATPETWENNVLLVLQKLGEARDVHRVYACKNMWGDNGLKVYLKYEVKQGGEKRLIKDDPQNMFAYEEVGLTRWAQVLGKGNVICGAVDKLQPGETAWNVSSMAQSIIVIPVFVGTEWWGYIGFENIVEKEDTVSKPELEAMRAVATLFAAAIRRKRLAEELEMEKQSVQRKVDESTHELQLAQAELKAALYHSKEEKARLTASIHSLSMGFILTSREGVVTLYNHAVNDILGSIDQPWTTTDLEARFAESVDFLGTIKAAVQEVKEIRIDELKYQDKWLRLYFTPIKMVDDDGQVIGLVCLIEDITETKELQRARDEFFAVASHELRTPLTAIKGNTQLLKRVVPQLSENKEAMEMMADIEAMCDRLTGMVNEYLDISRLETSKGTIQMETFNVVEIVGNVMRSLESEARGKGLIWELQLPSGFEVKVVADKGRSEQVVMNLLGNALKFTKQGGIYIKVERKEKLVKMAVYDTGEGISSEEQMGLFQKFKRVGDRVYERDVSRGTGMGLYISRLIAEAMRGRVYLEKSEKGVGSAFVFELPAAQ